MVWNSERTSFFKLALLAPVLVIIFSAALNAQQKYEIKNSKYKESTKAYDIIIQYPEMIPPKDALMGVRGMIGDFNLPIKAVVDNRVAEFKKDVSDFKSPDDKKQSTLGMGYEKFLDDQFVFSVKFSGYSDPEHAAHPIGLVNCVNFSYDRWDVFYLSDIFLKDKPFVKYISDYCIRNLKDTAKANDESYDADIEKGASADSNKFKAFNISNGSLIITFPENQVAPRMVGMPVVEIPLSNLADMIDPSGPLGYVAK